MARTVLPAITTDPTGELHGLPTYLWTRAPEGLATVRQLKAKGLRPGGQAPVAQIRRGRLIGYLYSVADAKPMFALTEAKRRAVETACAARRRCAECGRNGGYVPRQGAPAWGRCWDCTGGVDSQGGSM